MKKLCSLIVFVFIVASFTSCTELNDEDNYTTQDFQAIDKKDSSNPNNNGGEDPDDTED